MTFSKSKYLLQILPTTIILLLWSNLNGFSFSFFFAISFLPPKKKKIYIRKTIQIACKKNLQKHSQIRTLSQKKCVCLQNFDDHRCLTYVTNDDAIWDFNCGSRGSSSKNTTDLANHRYQTGFSNNRSMNLYPTHSRSVKAVRFFSLFHFLARTLSLAHSLPFAALTSVHWNVEFRFGSFSR